METVISQTDSSSHINYVDCPRKPFLEKLTFEWKEGRILWWICDKPIALTRRSGNSTYLPLVLLIPLHLTERVEGIHAGSGGWDGTDRLSVWRLNCGVTVFTPGAAFAR
jgi:hypothetical protein